MVIANWRFQSPTEEAHTKLMKMVKDGLAPGVVMENTESRSCKDPECKDIHAFVKVKKKNYSEVVSNG